MIFELKMMANTNRRFVKYVIDDDFFTSKPFCFGHKIKVGLEG